MSEISRLADLWKERAHIEQGLQPHPTLLHFLCSIKGDEFGSAFSGREGDCNLASAASFLLGNQLRGSINVTDNRDCSPLFFSVLRKRWELCKTLLDHLANPNQISRTEGVSPFHLLIHSGLQPRDQSAILDNGVFLSFLKADANLNLWSRLRYLPSDTPTQIRLSGIDKDFTPKWMIENNPGLALMRNALLSWIRLRTIEEITKLSQLDKMYKR